MSDERTGAPGPHTMGLDEIEQIKQDLLQFAGIGTYRFLMDGTIVHMDLAAIKVLELDHLYPDPEMVRGLKLGDLFHYIEEPASIRRKVLEAGRVRGVEYPFRTLDGKRKWAMHDAYLVSDSAANLPAVQVISRDITDLKLAQKALEEANLELEQSNAELRTLDRMKDSLLDNVSHELRSPLVAVRGYTELISSGTSGPVSARQRAQLNIILRNVNKLTGLIDDLLHCSHHMSTSPPLELDEIDLNELAVSAAAEVALRLKAGDLALQESYAVGEVRVTGDRDRLAQVLTNLLDNALKFTPPGGRITVATERLPNGQGAQLSISDTGPGFPAEMARKLFQRFFQRDGTRTRAHGGLGLGLAICKTIVEAHGGEIWARSTPGEGATFTLEVPRQARETGKAPGEAAVHSREMPAEQPPPGTQVMVVDDDRDIGTLMHDLLSLMKLTPVVLESGQAALQAMADNPPDIALLDMSIPDISGVELCRKIRSMPGLEKLPVFIISATEAATVRKAALAAGANGFLDKPFSMDDLMKTIRDALRQPAG